MDENGSAWMCRRRKMGEEKSVNVVSSSPRPYDVLLSTWSRPEVDLIKVEGMEGM